MVPTVIVSQEAHPTVTFIHRAIGTYQPSGVKKTFDVTVTVRPG